MVFPLFFKEGLGEIYQSVIMKLRLTDQPWVENLKNTRENSAKFS